ncbi:MAG TPA: 50S ribosomal protein L11 methyltransferase [Thermomicrobiales bacterium]|nr:50S ribosomal protein L11 methyltransferase [Thermomicrobiales bacterium]
MTAREHSASSPEWLELAVEVDHEAVEPVSELFSRYGFNEGVVIEEPFAQERDGENLRVDLSRTVRVSTFVAAADVAPGTIEEIRRALWHLGQMRRVGDLTVTTRREEDWANAWKEHYKPVLVGRRVVAVPPWVEYEAKPDEIVVPLDPGMAFGTGTHPTTRLAMQALEDELHAGDRVFDLGTGSGILAIAAAKLGAARVDAVDIEPVAVRMARANAEMNDVADRVRINVGSAAPIGGYDLVLANIIARILIELIDDVISATRPGGTVILSGVIDMREERVREAYEERGMLFQGRLQLEDWIALVYRRPAS